MKRIVGASGDTVQGSNNILFLNGRPLPYRATGRTYPVYLSDGRAIDGILTMEDLGRISHPILGIPGIQALRDFGPVVVPDGCYFVLGDNRDVSRDSRYFGVVPRACILGRARAVVLSFDITDKYQPRLGRFLTRLQ